MKLDNRLKKIADLVQNSKKTLDLGTDHGYLSLYLVQNQKAETVIASDISKPSLQKAIDLIKNQSQTDKIKCRLGSGLSVISEQDQVDTIIISGMGGILISQILKQHEDLIINTKPKLIMQPVQRPEILRKYLIENLYEIQEETLVESENKIYNIIQAAYKGKKQNYDKNFYEIGKKSQDKTYQKQIKNLIQKNEIIIKQMENSKNITPKKIQEKKEYLKFLKELKSDETK